MNGLQDVDHVARGDAERIQPIYHFAQRGAACHFDQPCAGFFTDLRERTGTTTVSPEAKGFG
jgi:hypothetical protein